MSGLDPVLRTYPGWFVGLLLLATTAYALSAGDYFLFDDWPNLAHASKFQSFDPRAYYSWVEAIFSNVSGPTGRPIAMFTFAVNVAASSAMNAQVLKITNVVLHLTCGLLAFKFVKSLLVTKYMPRDRKQLTQLAALTALTATFWLIAPIHVSTVLYPVQRMTQLSSIFTLIGLLVFLRYRGQLASTQLPAGAHFRFLVWFGLALFLAVFSKENGVLLLWYVALVEAFCFQGRWNGSSSEALRRLGLFVVFVPLFLLALAVSFNPWWAESAYAARDFSLWERLLTQFRVLWAYLQWIVFPSNQSLAIFHDDFTVSSSLISPISTMPAVGFLLIAIVGVIFNFRKLGLAAFGVLFFLIGHSIESTILPLEMVFEHRNYLPSLGIAVCIAIAIDKFAAILPRRAQVAVVVLVLLFYLLTLGQRLTAWSSPVWQAEQDFASHPDSPRALYILARAYENRAEVLSEQDIELKKDLILAARELYRRQQALDANAVAPLVLQYFLEVQYFRESPETGVLLESVGDLAKDINPSSSDISSLESLMDCGLNGICSEDTGFIANIADLWAQNPMSGYSGQLWQYKLHAKRLPEEENILLLDALIERYSFASELRYFRIIQAGSQGDVASVFSDLVSLYDNDRRKLSLLELKRMLDGQ